MLSSCFGLQLRTGTSIIAIANAIGAVFYIIFNIWQYYLFRKLAINYNGNTMPNEEEIMYPTSDFYRTLHIETEANSITLIFLLAGFTLLFVNYGLKHATLKNETHKIFLWLLVDYFQFAAIILMEIAVLIRFYNNVYSFIGFVIGFILFDAILTFQLLVVHSFYREEKLVEEQNYTNLPSRLAVEDQDNEEFHQVVLN